MKLPLLIFLTFASLFSAQSPTKVEQIRQTFKVINSEKNYTLKILDNDYFTDVKNQVTDNGQELKGYYKKGKLKKMVYYVGLSYGIRIYEFYYSNNSLIFVFLKQSKYVYPDHSSEKSNREDNVKLTPVFEGRYYFDQSKLFKTKETGKEMFIRDENQSKQTELLEYSTSFRKELAESRK